jgi:hypothetical protein
MSEDKATRDVEPGHGLQDRDAKNPRTAREGKA